MIEERINNSLKELERSLKDIESAKSQVERTINSYDDLSKSTSEYVRTLNTLTAKVKELVSEIGKDYEHNTVSFKKDRETIINNANAASQKLVDATESFQATLKKIQTRLNYSLGLNILMIFGILVVLFWVLK